MDKNVHHTNISIKEINKESSQAESASKGNPRKTDYDPRSYFVSWIDGELSQHVEQGSTLTPSEKNQLYIALLNFSENRAALKKPIPSKAAVSAILNRLVKFSKGASNRVEAMIDLLETATSSNWLTVYKPKAFGGGNDTAPRGRVYEEL